MSERKVRASTGKSGHILTRKLPKGVWYPHLVGKVFGYPKTQEAWQIMSDTMRERVKGFNARGITFRNGVPDGWGGRKKLIHKITAAAKADATRIVDKMIEEKRFVPDCYEARVAMEKAVEMLSAQKHTPEQQSVPLYSGPVLVSAMKTILDFTQRKPVATSELTLSKPEDFLALLAAKS